MPRGAGCAVLVTNKGHVARMHTLHYHLHLNIHRRHVCTSGCLARPGFEATVVSSACHSQVIGFLVKMSPAVSTVSGSNLGFVHSLCGMPVPERKQYFSCRGWRNPPGPQIEFKTWAPLQTSTGTDNAPSQVPSNNLRLSPAQETKAKLTEYLLSHFTKKRACNYLSRLQGPI